MSATGTTPISDLAPQGDDLTDYDHAHMTLYLRLFDAAESGASLQEISKILFGIDADTYPSDTVEITLEFDGADPVTFSAEVLSLASEMDGMDHENMDMDDEG